MAETYFGLRFARPYSRMEKIFKIDFSILQTSVVVEIYLSAWWIRMVGRVAAPRSPMCPLCWIWTRTRYRPRFQRTWWTLAAAVAVAPVAVAPVPPPRPEVERAPEADGRIKRTGWVKFLRYQLLFQVLGFIKEDCNRSQRERFEIWRSESGNTEI